MCLVKLFTILIIICLFVQFYYWQFLFTKLIKHSSSSTLDSGIETTNMSLVICSKQLRPDISNQIKVLMSQKQHSLTIYYIDNTEKGIIKSLTEEQYPQVKWKHLPTDKKGKKFALAESLGFVSGGHLLLTDDDCFPASEYWASSMLNVLEKEASDIVLGYSPIVSSSSSLLAKWANYESFITAIQYLSFAVNGWTYMGVGRNLLYRSNVLSREALLDHADLASGDDDLTINKMSEKQKISICIDKKAWVFSTPPESWSSYFKQKIRHYSTSHKYRVTDKIRLGLFSLSHILFYICLMALIGSGLWLLALQLYMLRMAFLFAAYFRLSKILDTRFGSFGFLFFDIALVLYYVIFAFAVFVPQKNKW